MIGYKATKNMKCQSLTYQIGKTYSINKLEMCKHGFHFCEKQEDTLNYYEYSDDFVLLEVEALGKVETKYDKSVTDKIKVLRVIPKEEYSQELLDKLPKKEYDNNNNLIHSKNSSGNEYWKEYDSKGNCIYFKDSKGNEEWNKYDKNNNLIYSKYDKNNNLIYSKYSSGNEYWKEYDKNNNLIHSKNSYGLEWKIEIE